MTISLSITEQDWCKSCTDSKKLLPYLHTIDDLALLLLWFVEDCVSIVRKAKACKVVVRTKLKEIVEVLALRAKFFDDWSSFWLIC